MIAAQSEAKPSDISDEELFWLFATSVGEMKIFNWLVYVYAMPAFIAAGIAWVARRAGVEAMSRFFGALALVLVLAFAFVSLEVRQWFHGAFLDGDAVSSTELFYSRSKAIWIASMFVMLAAMSKVFIYDTRHLEDMFRVFSYMGLGASLLGLFWAYRKWVFPPLDAVNAGEK